MASNGYMCSRFFLPLIVCTFIGGLQNAQSSTYELLWRNDTKVEGPNMGYAEVQWSVAGVGRFNSNGKFFSSATFSAKEKADDILFTKFGGGVIELTGTDTWTVHHSAEGFGGGVYPVDLGALVVGGRYQLGTASGTPVDLGIDVSFLFGVSRGNNRIIFTENREDGLANLNGFFPSGEIKNIWLPNQTIAGTDTIIKGPEQFFNNLHFNSMGRVAFFSELEGDGVSLANDRAIFFESETFELEVLVRDGDIFPASKIPGSDGVITIDAVPLLGLNSEGRVAFMAVVSSNVVPSGAIDSLWEIAPEGDKSLVVADRVPMQTASGAEVTFFGLFTDMRQPIVDELGNIYFTGSALTADGMDTEKTLWRKESGGLVKLVTFDNGSLLMPAPRLPVDNGDGTTTTYSVLFDRLLSLQVSDFGRVAFTANIEERDRVVDGEGNVVSTGRARSIGTGLWAQDAAGVWELVATRVARAESDNNPPTDPAALLQFSNAEEGGNISLFNMPSGNSGTSSNGNDGLAEPWWMPDGRLHFAISTFDSEVGSKTFNVAATIERTVPTGSGVKYIWDEGLTGIDWHQIEDDKTNWVDEFGVRWARPPTSPNAEVYIPKGPDSNPFQVELLQTVPEIATLEVEGVLEMHAALKVRESLIIKSTLFQRNGSSLISEGNVEVDGEIVAWENGIRTVTTDHDHLIESKGMIDGLETGIWAKADNGVQIDNRAMVGGDVIGIFTEVGEGLTFISNTGDITSTGGIGIRANSISGPIDIQSPRLGGEPVRISSYFDAIYATTADSIDVVVKGEITTISDLPGILAMGIHAVSTGGPVNIDSQGSLSGTSNTIEAGGIWAIGSGNVFAQHKGTINTDGWGMSGDSTEGNVVVDGREALIASNVRGLVGKAPNGTVTIYGGEMSVGKGTGILAEAGANVIIESEGPISTLGGIDAIVGSPGIHAVSTGGSVSITSFHPISTTTSSQSSPAIMAIAESDVLIESNGGLDTLTGDGMQLESVTGDVEVTHQNGHISVSGPGAGIRATSESGNIIISSNDPESRIGTLGTSGDNSASDGIRADARGSISISWTGDIEAFGFQANGIYARSDSSGISVTTSGDVSAFGDSGNGVVLSSPSTLTLNILGGSVGGSGSFGAGVRFVDGVDNKITNHGNIASFDGPGIQTADGNETVDNFGGIAGNINLGGGTNVLTNHPGSELFSQTEFNLGAGNIFDNSGLFQIGEEGEAVVTTVLTGNWIQQGSARLHVEFQETNEGSALAVSGSAALAGKLRIRLQDDYEPMAGDAFTLVTADSLSGAFRSAKVIEGSVNNAPVSRNFKVDLTYDASTAVAIIAALSIERYSDWREGFFSGSDAADETISGVGRDPDGDGYKNLAEYALGGDPKSADPDLVKYEISEASTGVTSLSKIHETPNASESVASISFNWANDVTDATWEIERSSDLENWEAVDSAEILMEPNGDYTRITATPQMAIGPDADLFLRLQIVEAPQP